MEILIIDEKSLTNYTELSYVSTLFSICNHKNNEK